MYNTFNIYLERYKRNITMINTHKHEVEIENQTVLKDICFTLILLFTPLSLVTLLVEPERFLWVFFIIIVLTSFVIYKNLEIIKEKSLTIASIYVLLTIIYIVCVYTGVVTSPSFISVVTPAFFLILPLTILDNPKRILFILSIFYIINIILIFQYKSTDYIILADYIHLTLFFSGGMFIGQSVSNIRFNMIRLKKELSTRENIDFLTKLPNRRKLFQQFAENKELYGIIMLDVDNFKKYNDTYGHQQGDEVLKALSKCLVKSEQYNVEFFRYGGEEFVGIYSGKNNDELTNACNFINDEVRKLQIPHIKSGKGFVTASMGFYYSPVPITDEAVIKYADMALYMAKELGKDTSVPYENSMQVN